MVAPAAEGKGVARALIRFLETRGASAGHTCIRLDVFVQNPRAVRFYERSSYRRAGLVRFRKGDFFCYEKILENADSRDLAAAGALRTPGQISQGRAEPRSESPLFRRPPALGRRG
jgi:ribosomal protein S18 acetylase RimI-like enzyme